MKKSKQKINGWDAAYKENPQQFVEPDKVCALLDTLFPKYHIKHILDLGCGNGRHLLYFEKSEHRMVGSDLSWWGLQAARQWLRAERQDARLAQADMQHLPFADGSFDAIISFRVIQHNLYADIQQTFHEIQRVIRSEGLLVIDLLKYNPQSERFKDAVLVEPNTFIPQSGTEKGMPHHAFTTTEVFQLLHGWRIKFFDTQGDEKHFTIIAQK